MSIQQQQQQQQKKLTIGLFGFGVVGEGLYKVLQSKPGLNATIKKVCIKHAEKQRLAPKELFTTDAQEILNDKEINVIVELINDADAAFSIVAHALRSRKAVVSANKKLIAENLETLLALQQEFDVPFLYEAAACASIPVIRNLEEYYDNDLLQSISGIVNGSTNYMLTKVFDEGIDFAQALKQAQEEGFAESNPSTDVEGVDAVNKLTILLTHGYGTLTQPQELIYCGIQNLKPADAIYAKEKGLSIKLVAQAHKLEDGKIAAFVLPQFVQKDSQLYNINHEYNGVVIESSLADKQFFYGKGAGGFPTASAVLSDLSALRYNYRYEYKKLLYQIPAELSDDFYLQVYLSVDRLTQIPKDIFEEITHWSSSETHCFVTGIIHSSRLRNNDWWKRAGASLILLPNGVVQHSGTKNWKAEMVDVLVV